MTAQGTSGDDGPSPAVLADVLASVTAGIARDQEQLAALVNESIERHGLGDFLEGVYWALGAFMLDTCNRTGDEPHQVIQRIAMQVALGRR